MSKFATDSIKLTEKAKELGITVKELTGILNDAGYNYSHANQVLKPDALQFLAIEEENISNIVPVENGIENAVVVTVGDKFAVVTVNINSKLEVKEISRTVFDNRSRAYYELDYLVSKYELGR
jgi:phage antirepressor YoqD-like protein